jgi:hypothetical protein
MKNKVKIGLGIGVCLILGVLAVFFLSNNTNIPPTTTTTTTTTTLASTTTFATTTTLSGIQCVDSEGVDYDLAGSITYIIDMNTGRKNTLWDKCTSTTDLMEYICIPERNDWGANTHTCPNGCSNGACV